ncbi:polysaccharide biosynthesis tyrosine autokinase [Desulfobulbus rhabdoformis]|uniref:GumC family protein n=1 Tax=Desulfobulbus rhabdoformis TaxID=34032 RepID=UPI001962537F|nr:polysaccharide biosynthesis tyrosine autokinase [Desulfobulbus rhabdoformis]MBM9612682.1 polysaccharide biosynthesis tyrosine autokinase [Desulfobulbus rhabdoformis]
MLQKNARHLPSVEVRELVPEFEDEINLRELFDVLLRHKWAVMTVLLICFFSAVLITFSTTPLFKATGSLKVSAASTNLTKFDSLENNAMRSLGFQQTQVKILESDQVASRVIKQLNLNNNPTFNPAFKAKSGEAQASSLLGTLKSFIRPDDTPTVTNVLTEEAKQQILENRMLARIKGGLKVIPVERSELIEVHFTSPDPNFAASATNAAMDAFINLHTDGTLKASQAATRFLEMQIHAAQIKLENSEIALQDFARKIGVISLDPKTNVTYRQMEELNDALAKARAERITKEARYVQYKETNVDELSEIMSNEMIQELKSQQATLESEYENLAVTFKPEYPQMRQLKARMDDIETRIKKETKNVFESIKNDYLAALKIEQFLENKTSEQKEKTLELEKQSIQYKIYARQVETNKSIYQSLLQRAKEIEATVGAEQTNIQIIDRARPPMRPFKPKMSKNLLLGIMLGLVGGIAVAFLFEHFDNTIKDADELTDRYRIPVLGVIPYDKEGLDNPKTMALKFYEDPRSPVAEAFRTTMTSVRLSVADHPPKTLLLTSILPGAGKSSLSVNTALSYLAEDERCLLIDVDLRKPSMHGVLSDGDKGVGVSSILSGQVPLYEGIQQTSFANLDFISSGPLPPNPAEMLSSKRMRQLIEEVSRDYDRVILDGPPYQGFAEILVLANMVDGVILVTTEENTPREGVKLFRNALNNIGGRILGAIINKAGRKKRLSTYGNYQYYAYNYEYGKKSKG